MFFKCFVIYLCFLNAPTLQAARILSVFGFPGPSQYEFIEPLLKELAGRGHQITSISNYPQTEQVQNFRDVVINENVHLFDAHHNFSLDNIVSNYYDIIEAVYNKAFQMCLNILDNPAVRNMLATEKFDLILLDVFFSESLFGLAEHFQAPIVGISTLGTWPSVDELVGNVSPISYIPDMILPFKEMNFWQRFLNVMIYLVELAHYYLKYMPIQKQIYDRYFPKAEISFKDAHKNFALVLVNDHFTLSAPRPYVPNMIEVAGLHINTKPEPIPKATLQILDTAKEGVIFIELDPIISSKAVNLLLKQLRKMKQVSIFKTTLKIESNAPNVFINANYSRTSILANPNVKLFISHGGYLSIVESIYHGIPILGLIPANAAKDYVDYIKKVGNGLSLKEQNISDKTLSIALNELLNASYYSNLAKEFSKRFRDQQSTHMERAVYWIEYVLRHNGAGHLRNKGQNLTWYQYHNIDIYVLLFCITVFLICLAYIVIKLILKLFWKFNFKKTKTD